MSGRRMLGVGLAAALCLGAVWTAGDRYAAGVFCRLTLAAAAAVGLDLTLGLTGQISLSDLSFTLPTGENSEPIVLAYGQFLQTVLDFFLISLSIFLAIKVINRFRRKKEEEPKAPPQPTKEELLLTEIRDLMASQVQAKETVKPMEKAQAPQAPELPGKPSE